MLAGRKEARTRLPLAWERVRHLLGMELQVGGKGLPEATEV